MSSYGFSDYFSYFSTALKKKKPTMINAAHLSGLTVLAPESLMVWCRVWHLKLEAKHRHSELVLVVILEAEYVNWEWCPALRPRSLTHSTSINVTPPKSTQTAPPAGVQSIKCLRLQATFIIKTTKTITAIDCPASPFWRVTTSQECPELVTIFLSQPPEDWDFGYETLDGELWCGEERVKW